MGKAVKDDDSVIAQIGGVTFAVLTRVSICFTWLGFWLCRVMLTDSLDYRFTEPRSIAIELLGKNPFDQGFSIGMAMLTVQVWLITWPHIKGGTMGLIARSAEAWSEGVARRLSPKAVKIIAQRLSTDDLREILEKRERDEKAETATSS